MSTSSPRSVRSYEDGPSLVTVCFLACIVSSAGSTRASVLGLPILERCKLGVVAEPQARRDVGAIFLHPVKLRAKHRRSIEIGAVEIAVREVGVRQGRAHESRAAELCLGG